MQPEDNRRTYIHTEQYETDKLQHMLDYVRHHANDYLQLLLHYSKSPKLREHPDLVGILLESPGTIYNVIQCCLQPSKLNVTDNSLCFAARDLLRDNPCLAFKMDQQQFAWLFEFLQQEPNTTSLSYFTEILALEFSSESGRLYIEEFRSSTPILPSNRFLQLSSKIDTLLNTKSTLDLLLSKVAYPPIFSMLFQWSTSLCDINTQAKQTVFNSIMAVPKLNREQHLQNIANTLESVICVQNKKINSSCSIFTQLAALDPIAKCWIAKLFDQKYVARLLQDIKVSYDKQQHQIVEYSILILIHIVKYFNLYNTDDQQLAHTFQKAVSIIVASLDCLVTQLLKPAKDSERKFSTGEDVKEVGFVRFYCIELIRVILELDAKIVINNYQLGKNLVILQRYLVKNKWNNLIHNKIISILELLINKFENYEHYEDRYIGKAGLLCFLIEQFRGRHFLFMNSNQISTYGHTNSMYLIAKNISIKLSQSEKLREIMQNFMPWEKFIKEDLQKYEQEQMSPLGGSSDFIKQADTISVRDLIAEMNKEDLKQEGQYFFDKGRLQR